MPVTEHAKRMAQWAKRRKLIKRQFDNGATAIQLAETHGVDVQRIYQILKKEGATFRSYGAKK